MALAYTKQSVFSDVNAQGAEHLSQAEDDLLGFSPIHVSGDAGRRSLFSQSLSGIRNTCVFLAMIMHWNVTAMLDFHKGMHEASIRSHSSTPTCQTGPVHDNVKALEDLWTQSTDLTLMLCRAQVSLFRVSTAEYAISTLNAPGPASDWNDAK